MLQLHAFLSRGLLVEGLVVSCSGFRAEYRILDLGFVLFRV